MRGRAYRPTSPHVAVSVARESAWPGVTYLSGARSANRHALTPARRPIRYGLQTARWAVAGAHAARLVAFR